MTSRIRKRVVKFVVPMVAVALAGVPTVGRASPDRCGELQPYVETLRVRIKAREGSYRIGESAVVDATVDRAVAGHLVPVEGADVFVGLKVGETFAFAGGVTDEQGIAAISVRLRKHLATGTAKGMALARIQYADTPCEPVDEEAWTEVDEFVKIRPFKRARV